MTTSGLAITPLNPSLTSVTSTNTPGSPVYLVPAPLLPLVIHLSPSASPTTAIANSNLISNVEERPPSLTHFGQADSFVGRRLFLPVIETDKWNTSLIDHVEPFDMLAPVENPTAPPAPAPANAQPQAPPDAAPARPLPPVSDPNVDAALDLTDDRLLTRSRDGEGSQADEQFSSTNTSWSFSVIFGAAAVAVGGYHLALREADRSQGRSIPRWLANSAETSANAGRRPCEAPELTTQTRMAGSFSLPANFVSYIEQHRRTFRGCSSSSTSARKVSCG